MPAVKICPACSREFPSESTHCADDGVGLVALQMGTEARPEALIGQIVEGRYRIERIIGRGGMGYVYACRHVVVGKPAAMKVMRLGVERSEGVLQRFIREAQTANSIRSRHITEMTDFGQLPNGFFFVVMELLEGMSLSQAMREGQLTRMQLIHVFIQIAEALDQVHAAGVVHRDLKPDNVFLVHENNDPLFVKLLDFGIAKVMHAEASMLTETGVILGTPYFMSPEQARGESIDARADIYALGVIMYRAFTGKLPFVAESMVGVLTRHLTQAPEPPSKLVEIDGRLEAVILRCLEKPPAARFQSMGEVMAALIAIAKQPYDARFHEEPTGGPSRVLPPPSPSGPGAAYPVSGAYPGAGAALPHAPAASVSGVMRPAAPSAPSGAYAPVGASAPSGPYAPVSGAPMTGGYMPANALSWTGSGSAVNNAPAPTSGAYAAMGPGYAGAVPSTPGGSHPSGTYSVPGVPSSSGLFATSGLMGGAASGPPSVYPAHPGHAPEQVTQRGLATSSTGRIDLKPRRNPVVVIAVAVAVAAVASAVVVALLVSRPNQGASEGASTAGPAAAQGALSGASSQVPAAAAVTGAVSAAPSAEASAAAAEPTGSGATGAPTGAQPPRQPAVGKTAPPPVRTARPAGTTPPGKRPEIRSPFE